MEINDKLSHLSSEQIDELIERYYNNEKINDLLSEYDIKCRSSELVKLFPPEVLDDILCEYCNTPMMRKRVSRTSYTKGEIYCPKCEHIYENINCRCESCNNKKRQFILNTCIDKPIIDIKDIDLKNRVYLAALLRCIEFSNVDNKIILKPLKYMNGKICPTDALKCMIIESLIEEGILSLDKSSSIDAFCGNLVDNTYGKQYYLYEVNFSLNIKYSLELSNPDINLSYEDDSDIEELCKEILLNECYEYLENQMRKVKFSFNPGNTTREVFLDLLDKFSVSQIFAIIYNSINGAARYYQEGNVSKHQAANSVITKCRTYGERIIANRWDIKSYSRPYDCRQSVISELFFNRIFPIGDEAFYTVFTKENMERNMLKFIR